MIDHITAENFRCFHILDVKGLKRLNIVVGRNSSGKSSFLEALFLSAGSTAPHTVFQMRAIRKVGGPIHVPTDIYAYKSLWEDLFYDFDTDSKIVIQAKGSSGDQRSLSVSIKGGVQQEIPFTKESLGSPNVGGLPQIVFTWKRGGGREIVIKPQITQTGLNLGNTTVDFFPMIWFTPGAADAAEDTAKRFSALSKRDEIGPIVAALKNEFDFIEDFSIEFFSGSPMIFASVKGMRRKIPVGLMSDGINRLLAILLGIAYFKNGVVLIDQIEDGFYFDHFESIWKIIHFFSVKYNVQLFITTHSRECLEAVKSTLGTYQNDFRLLRAERREFGCSISQFDGKDFLAAIEEKLEIR